MKKISTLVVGIVVLTSFLFINRSNAQVGPEAGITLWYDSTNSLIDFDSVFYAPPNDWPYYESPKSDYNGFSMSNAGDEPLTYTFTTSHPGFRGEFLTTFTLLPGQQEDHYVSFRPKNLGPTNGIITVTTNDPNREVIVFNVKGYGLESPVDASTEQFDLVIGTSVTKQMVVRNTTASRAKFRIEDHSLYQRTKLTISKNGVVLGANDDFILDSGDSATVDLLFESIEPLDPNQDDPYLPLFIVCQPFHFEEGRILSVYKLFRVDGIFPDATISTSGPIFAEVPISSLTSGHFTITNVGNTTLDYTIDTDSLLSESSGVRLMATGFEEFTPGIAHLQNGWIERYDYYATENHEWRVENANPFSGTQHLRCTSNGIPKNSSMELRAPEPGGNATQIDMMVDLDLRGGTTGEFNYNAGKLVVAADGSLWVLPEISNDLKSISSSLPNGYFNLRFAISPDHKFTISVDGVVIYEELFSNASHYQFESFGIAIVSEGDLIAGSILDVDDFKFLDGNQNVRLLSVQPASGSVPPNSSESVEVLYDTRNIDAGTYSEIFTIQTNDSMTPKVFVPMTTVVKPNVLPVLTGDFSLTIKSGETASMHFGAIDPDDSLVSVTFSDFFGGEVGWIEDIVSGSKFLDFNFATVQSEQDLPFTVTITARDSRGGITTRLSTINLLASLWDDFSLTNFKTGDKLATFTDTVTVDIAHPDMDKLTIQSNIHYNNIPNYVAGVKFILDGAEINRDKTSPYYLSSWALPKLTEGYHTLNAIAYSYYEGREYPIANGRTIVHVINSAAITNYEVVNKDGVKVMDLIDGSVIDLSKMGSNGINIIASTSISSVRSVKFVLNNVTARIDNGAPYALAGNPISGDTFWKVKAGNYTLSAIPYLKYFGWGPKGKPLTINFKVINGTIPAATIARVANSTNEKQIEEAMDSEAILSIYPVPVKDELHIELHESVKGNVAVNIMNAQGQAVHTKTGNADNFRKYSISTVQLGIGQGIYFVIVNQENGGRLVKKFIKE